MNENERKAWLYRFRFDNGEIAYIGNTTNLSQRLKNHRAYWIITEPMIVDIMRVPYDERYKIESALIKRYRPTQNSFVMKYDNCYKNIAETWIPILKIYSDSEGKFSEIEDIRLT